MGGTEGGGLIVGTAGGIVNHMRRLNFAALALGSLPVAAHAQQVPGRELLDFPLGTLAEAPALAAQVGDGLWNPATILLRDSVRVRVALAALASSSQQGVAVESINAAVALPRRVTAGLALLRASVRDLVRTETDPQSVGGEMPYGTTLLSLAVARGGPRVTTGAALRWRRGELDTEHGSALGFDAGAVGRLGWRDLRVAASSYLWHPGSPAGERAALTAAADLRLDRGVAARELRAGLATTFTESVGHEDYLHASLRAGRWALRGGVVRVDGFGMTSWGSRLGLGVYYARYSIGVSREEGDAGLPPTYQFTLTSSFQ